jgi:hypothetical protein
LLKTDGAQYRYEDMTDRQGALLRTRLFFCTRVGEWR